jgi:hypothetical protein
MLAQDLGNDAGKVLRRIAFNQPAPQVERRESLLTQLDARIRDVREGPRHGMALRIEPVE